MPLCKCGCGTELPEGRQYVMYHHLKEAREKPLRMYNLRKATAGRHRKRKYKKRDKKYWNADGTVKKAVMMSPPPKQQQPSGSRMTDYCIPAELEREFDQMKAMIGVCLDNKVEYIKKMGIMQAEIDRLRDKMDSVKDMLIKEHNVKLKFAGVG